MVLTYVVLDLLTFVFSIAAFFYAFSMYRKVGKEKDIWPWRLIMLLAMTTLVFAASSLLALSTKFCAVLTKEFCLITFSEEYPSYVTISKIVEMVVSMLIFAICYTSYKEYDRLIQKFEK